MAPGYACANNKFHSDEGGAELQQGAHYWYITQPTTETQLNGQNTTVIMSSSRAPKRGSTNCSVCGESNGNRAVQCKSCGVKLQGRETSKRPKLTKLSQEVTLFSAGENKTRIFSCKVRWEGPDYRTFITETNGTWKCFYKGCHAAQNVRQRSLDINTCEHISAVQREHTTCESSPAHMNLSIPAQDKVAVPHRYQKPMLKLFEETPCLVQRVSEDTFVVRDSIETQEHPLKLLHVRFNRSKHQTLFHCPCSEYQRSMSGAAVTAKLTRRCIHLYLCLWAIKSNPDTARDFPSIFASSGSVCVCVCVCACAYVYVCACMMKWTVK